MTNEEVRSIIIRILNEKEREKRQPLPLLAELQLDEPAIPDSDSEDEGL